MAAPPTPFGRATFPVPSRRPRGQSSRTFSKQSSLARILAGAAAVTASRSWILADEETTGGIGLLLLGLWSGRILAEVVEMRRDRKGKRKEVGYGDILTSRQLLSVGVITSQAVAFLLAVKMIGPLRGSMLAITSSTLGPHTWGDETIRGKKGFPLVPAILACSFVLFDAHKRHGPWCLVTLSMLVTCTLALAGPLASTLEPRPRSRGATGYTLGQLGKLIMVLASCALSVFALSLMHVGHLPNTFSLEPSYHLILPVITAALSRYMPLPFVSTHEPKPAARLRSARDYTIYLVAITTLQFFALHPVPASIDVLLLLPLVLTSIFLTSRSADPSAKSITSSTSWKFPSPAVHSKTWSPIRLLPASWRPYLQTILHTDSSRKIFYFLLVNLAYMGVQMGYGIITNSLGLISDAGYGLVLVELIITAIHMFFDCLGIGIGLWASVASTWKPDGRYTYGYGRIETLSGFANGLFLILISISIIFEGIQRIMDPPEMETQQLLLVSSIGLGINLFGMWATGGHHHHHGHGHDGHEHGHVYVHAKKEDHSHPDEPTMQRVTDDYVSGTASKQSPTEASARPRLSPTRRRSSGRVARPSSINFDMTNHLHSDGDGVHHHNHLHGRDQPLHNHSDHHHHDHHEHHHSHDDAHHSHNHSHHPSHTHCELDHAHGNGNGSPTMGDRHTSAHRHTHDQNISHSHSTDHLDHSPSHSHGHHHDHDRDHNHGHSHGHSHNMRGVFLHVMADTLGSVGVIISTLLIKWTGWTVFDPIASLFIAAMIMASVVPLVIDSGKVLCLDVGSNVEKDIKAALANLAGIEGLANYGAPRFWPRLEGEIVGSIHIHLARSPSAYDPTRTPGYHRGPIIYANAERVADRVERALKARIPGLTDLVIQIEGSEDKVYCDCMAGGG